MTKVSKKVPRRQVAKSYHKNRVAKIDDLTTLIGTSFESKGDKFKFILNQSGMGDPTIQYLNRNTDFNLVATRSGEGEYDITLPENADQYDFILVNGKRIGVTTDAYSIVTVNTYDDRAGAVYKLIAEVRSNKIRLIFFETSTGGELELSDSLTQAYETGVYLDVELIKI